MKSLFESISESLDTKDAAEIKKNVPLFVFKKTADFFIEKKKYLSALESIEFDIKYDRGNIVFNVDNKELKEIEKSMMKKYAAFFSKDDALMSCILFNKRLYRFEDSILAHIPEPLQFTMSARDKNPLDYDTMRTCIYVEPAYVKEHIDELIDAIDDLKKAGWRGEVIRNGM